MRNLESVETFKAEVAAGNYSQYTASSYDTYLERIQQAQDFTDEISIYYPAETFIRYSTYDGKKHFEGTETLLKHDLYSFTIHRISQGSKKWFNIFAWEMHQLKHQKAHDARQRATNAGITEPNKIGQLTTKKIQAWVSYYEEVLKLAAVYDSERSSVEDNFLKGIEGLPVYYYSDNNKRGEIRLNGLVFEFEMSNGYISQRIKVDAKATVENFLAMAKNEYKK